MDPEYETIGFAVKDLSDGTDKTIKANNVKAHTVSKSRKVDPTSHHRFPARRSEPCKIQACHQAYKDSQLPNEAQENVVNEWFHQNSCKASFYVALCSRPLESSRKRTSTGIPQTARQNP